MQQCPAAGLGAAKHNSAQAGPGLLFFILIYYLTALISAAGRTNAMGHFRFAALGTTYHIGQSNRIVGTAFMGAAV